ncbi:MAG: domain containing protein [Gemmatimonadetes bacterium]|nr:domain containing protein [Gemmatimonadota bacterium]
MPLPRRTLRHATVHHRNHRPLDSLLRGAAAAAVALTLIACQDTVSGPAPAPLAPSGPDRTLTGAGSTEIFAGGSFGTRGDARAINNAGHVTGASTKMTESENDYRPYRWAPGAGSVRLSGVCCGTAWGSDINDAGVVVGTAQTSQNTGLRAFRATDATMVNLGILPGASNEGSSRAMAINASGEVVGSSTVGNIVATHAVLWTASNVIQDLGSLGGNTSVATDINASGQVVGTSTLAGETETHFFLWSAGSGMTDLSMELGALTSVIGINDVGQIAGSFTTAGGDTHAFLYTPGSGLRDLGTLGGASSSATGLNNVGQVVGRSTTADGATHSFLWTPTDGMEDITAITGVTDVQYLNDRLQTVSGRGEFGLANPLPRVIQLNITPNAAPVARFTWSCPGLTCTLDGTTSSDDKGIVSYEWKLDRSPDSSATGATVTASYPHQGTRNVTLTVTDANGLMGSVTQTITVGSEQTNQPPVAQFTSSCASLACTFDSGGSTDDAGIVSRAWAFGDGATTSDVASPSHSYEAPGTYTVTLTVTDAGGLSSTISKQTVVAPPPDAPPVPRFTWSCANLVCTFDATSSSDDREVRFYRWNLDNDPDGSAFGSKVTASYPHGGTRTVTLTVTDSNLQESSLTHVITVQ